MAGLEQRHAIAHALHLVEQVRGQEHGHAFALERLDELEEFDRRGGIEAGCRLIEDRDLGLLHHDLGKAEPLAHAARKRADPLVGNVIEAYARERGADALPAFRRRDAHQARRIGQVLGRRHVVVEADLIGQIPDPALDRERLAHRVVTEHAGLPVRDVAQSEQHQDGGRLAGAVWSQQPEDLAPRHRERDALDDGGPVVALGEVLDLDDTMRRDDGRAHRRPNLKTAPTITRSATPMIPAPAMPQTVEVVTATRNWVLAASPREVARMFAM